MDSTSGQAVVPNSRRHAAYRCTVHLDYQGSAAPFLRHPLTGKGAGLGLCCPQPRYGPRLGRTKPRRQARETRIPQNRPVQGRWRDFRAVVEAKGWAAVFLLPPVELDARGPQRAPAIGHPLRQSEVSEPRPKERASGTPGRLACKGNLLGLLSALTDQRVR